MKKNTKIFTLLMGLGLASMPIALRAQTSQLIDCSGGNAQCDMLYSSEDLFVGPECPDCVTGRIQVEPAVVKTSYQPLGYAEPNVRQSNNTIKVTRQMSVQAKTNERNRRVATQLQGKDGHLWVTHDLNEKLAYGDDVHDWEAARGETLKSLLTQWAEVSGWTLIWKLDRDYNLEAGVVFRGTFTEVSSAIIRTFARAVPAPIGTFYKGNKVLVISIQEDENAH